MAKQSAEGSAVVSLTLSDKDLGRVSKFRYCLRPATDGAVEEVRRRPNFASALQQGRWLQDKQAQGPAAIGLIVKDPSSREPLDVIDGGKSVGRVAVLRLPAGDYELYDWKLVILNRYGGDELGPKRAAAYRFRVEAGRATYLGNLDLRVTDQDTYRISVEDKTRRDLALLSKKKAASQGAVVIPYRPPVSD